MKREIVMMIVSAFMLCQLNAQDFKITAEISNDTIMLGAYVEVKFTIENATGTFTAPEFTGLRLVSGPNQSSQYSMINGVVSQQASYAYYLMPEDAGMKYIDPGTFVVDGEEYTTPELKCYVIDNPDFDPSSLPPLRPGMQPSAPTTKPKPKHKVIRI